MSEAVNRSLNLDAGTDYLTILSPGKTGLRFDKGKPLRVDNHGWPWFTIVIKSATVANNQLRVAWACTDINFWGTFESFEQPDISLGDKKVSQHFESKNINELFSVIRTEVLTEGMIPSELHLPDIPNPFKPVGNLLDKAGTALIVLAVGLALFAGYKAFGGNKNG